MNEETKPTPAPKAAVKPPTKSIDLVNPVEIPKLATPQPTQNNPPRNSPLSAFQALLDKAPKEHLPTMMVRIANKCLAEKVFATPAEMAAAIVGASKK